MKAKFFLLMVCFMLAVSLTNGCVQSQSRWAVHDSNRPQPRAVMPGRPSSQAPSDAIVLFDGKDLSSHWVCGKDGLKPRWKVENGYTEIIGKSGDILTKQAFGSCQLHIEWASVANEIGQRSSNSGIFLMSKYEIQILNSFENKTYPDGQAAAVYGQQPPMVNASLPPGEWQSYDIIFHRPIFEGKKVVRPATITILHNGVLVQDHYQIKGTTQHKKFAYYEPHADKLPLKLQDHRKPVRFRNIWIRELPE